MWPFRKKPIVVTSDQLADTMMQFILRSGKHLHTELLQARGAQKWSLQPAEITLLNREILVAMLWAAAKAMGSDKRLLDALHDQYLQSCYRSGATHEEGAVYELCTGGVARTIYYLLRSNGFRDDGSWF